MPYPFDRTGIHTGRDGIRRYRGLAQNLVTLLRAAVERAPGRAALVELGGERIGYRELWQRAARAAGGMRDAGVEPGDRVGIHLPNGNDWAIAFWATQLAGGVVVPVNTRLTEPEVRYVLDDAAVSLVITPDGALPDGPPVKMSDHGHTDPAAIFYTSGTTGAPKGAVLTHENFLSNAETCLRCLGLDRQEPHTTLISVPLFHVTACNSQLLVMVANAGTSVIMPTFDVGAFVRAVADEHITVLTTVPAIYWLALRHPALAAVDT